MRKVTLFFKRKKFSVKVTGRAGVIYKEGDKTLIIDSEMLSGNKYDMIIYIESMNNWEPPYDKLILTENDKKQIMENIDQDLKKINIEWG